VNDWRRDAQEPIARSATDVTQAELARVIEVVGG